MNYLGERHAKFIKHLKSPNRIPHQVKLALKNKELVNQNFK